MLASRDQRLTSSTGSDVQCRAHGVNSPSESSESEPDACKCIRVPAKQAVYIAFPGDLQIDNGVSSNGVMARLDARDEHQNTVRSAVGWGGTRLYVRFLPDVGGDITGGVVPCLRNAFHSIVSISDGKSSPSVVSPHSSTRMVRSLSQNSASDCRQDPHGGTGSPERLIARAEKSRFPSRTALLSAVSSACVVLL